ncbi:MAG: aldo/keto reductase, partial [Synergistaceae bacterium]|nr:aldo/keto reductase [Synergistaceae bacterium]
MGKIETRNFGNGEISLLGFGLMRLPCLGSWEEIDRKAARALIEEAIAGGVNYFDTAYIYHVGNSESLAGETLSGYDRSAYHLATKMPLMEEVIKNAGGVDSIFNAQLERCCVDYFDFYLLHGVTADALRMIGDLKIYETLAKKKTEGRIRHLGFSFHDNPELLRRMTSDYDFDFAQIQLNYFDWEAQSAKEQYEILEGKKIPVHVMEPIKGGTLATLRPRALKIFEEADSHASAASWALRWVASLSGVQVVLSGMSAMEQLRDNIKTFTPFKPLTEEEYAVVEKALAEFKKTAAVPCTG